MAKFAIDRGSTSVTLHVFIQDSSSTTGAGKTGLTYASSGLAAKKIRDGETLSAALTIEDIAVLGTYAAPTSNAHIRFKELNSASPTEGMYEIQIHNDWADATGTRRSLIICFGGASGMAPLRIEIELQTPNAAQSGDSYARIGAAGAGLTALGDTRVANLDATVSSRATPAQVLTQIDAALDTAGTELSAVPSTTGTIRQKLNFIFSYFRNKRSVNKTTKVETLFKEDASTTLGTETYTDDGTTFTKGEMN